MALTAAQKAEYARNGYIVVENLVKPSELAELRRRIDEIQEGRVAAQTVGAQVLYEPGAGGAAVAAKPVLRKLSQLATNDEFFRGIASKQSILDCVAELTGQAQNIMLYSDQAFLKPALHGSEKPLHQDNSYFKATPMDFGVTCWMAIDDATVENGCMNYIPGSHKLGLIPHKEIPNTPHLIPDGSVKLEAEVPCPIPAGACIFHHLLALHSSKANKSPKSRRAWALHYVNAKAECPSRDYADMLKVR